MDLRSGHAFWPIQDGLMRAYPPLLEDAHCDVVILGGGITGALMAWHLAEAGIDTLTNRSGASPTGMDRQFNPLSTHIR